MGEVFSSSVNIRFSVTVKRSNGDQHLITDASSFLSAGNFVGTLVVVFFALLLSSVTVSTSEWLDLSLED